MDDRCESNLKSNVSLKQEANVFLADCMVKANAIKCYNAFTILIILYYVKIFYAITNVSPLMLAFVPFNGDKSTFDITV